ncbi:MAG: RraA family protein [Bacteroidetes bacterium]|nr:RraA family protein [Bacteroidota bacterium]MBU1680012.1 RraA family protein [Bacteroidota bacterium]
MKTYTFHSNARSLSRISIYLFLSFVITVAKINAQELTTPEGVKLLQNKSFNDDDEARGTILTLYKDLRLTDVLDGMDLIGLQDIGLMDKRIRPLWRDVDNFTHRIVGFAITVRHLPTDVRAGQNSFPDIEGFKKYKEEQYKRAPDAWRKIVRPGDIAVIDANGIDETGFIGSNNSLGFAEKGLVGFITNGGARDTDEIIKVKKIAVYCQDGYSSRGIRPGRLIAESYNFPINCGGVTVFPGDVIIADGDGVLVVPRSVALEVGKLAREINIGDEKVRRERFLRLEIPLDETVEER